MHRVVEQIKADPTFATLMLAGATRRGYADVFAWASAEPVMVLALAEALGDLDLADIGFEEAVEMHREAQRGLS